jgi:D-threo-aldose 1-dehydrogenase
MNPFERVEIRKTGVRVTRLGLGGAPLSGMKLAGGLYGGSAFDEAVRIVRRAYELGVRYFDTAPLYGAGRSEARFAAAFRSFPRDSFVISSKVGRVLELEDPSDPRPTGPERLPALRAVFDLSRDGILRALDETLKRLNTDRVEILFLHDPDVENLEDAANRTAFPAMLELREQGVVKAIGTGMNQWEMPLRFIRRFDIDVVLLAGRYTLLDHSGLAEFLPECDRRNTKVVVGGPYNSGILARDLSGPVTFNYQAASPDLVARAKALKAVCDRHHVDLKAAALQFVLAHPAIVSAIPGAQSVAELEENARVAAAPIPADLWRELKAEGLIPSHAPVPA